jgi:hypothetical protein
VPLLFFYNWFAHRTFRGKLLAAQESRDMSEAR